MIDCNSAGDVAFRVVDAIQKAEQRVRGDKLSDADEEDRTKVYVCDINPNMLEVGKTRAKERGDPHLPQSHNKAYVVFIVKC